MFPIYIYEQGSPLPNDGNYYIVAGDGIWLRKDTGIVAGIVKVENISFLDEFNGENVTCKLPKLPAEIVWKIQQFFKMVWSKYKSEANTILFYNKRTCDFKVYVPVQVVTHAGVRYKKEACQNLPEMEGYLMVGTIHSHADFSAFHSGTDMSDEENFDGLHVTFGNNDQDDWFSISASVVMNGSRVIIDPFTCLEGIQATENKANSVAGYSFKLENPEPEWSEGLDQWMSQVSAWC